MMTTDHWTHFKLFLQAKAEERKMADGNQAIEMIPEFWDILSDERVLASAVEDLELDRIKKAIPRQEESLQKLKDRKAELEKDREPDR